YELVVRERVQAKVSHRGSARADILQQLAREPRGGSKLVPLAIGRNVFLRPGLEAAGVFALGKFGAGSPWLKRRLGVVAPCVRGCRNLSQRRVTIRSRTRGAWCLRSAFCSRWRICTRPLFFAPTGGIQLVRAGSGQRQQAGSDKRRLSIVLVLRRADISDWALWSCNCAASF